VETPGPRDYGLEVSRLALVVVSVAVVVALVAASIARKPTVQKAEYLQANARLLAALPTFPGARREIVVSEPWQVRMEPYGRSYVVGYTTRATYRAPEGTTAAAVSRSYRVAMRGWRITSWGKIPEGWPRVIVSRDGRYIVNRSYSRGDENVSVDLLGFLRRGRIIRGGLFTVSVDYRAYEPRRVKFVCCAFALLR
jgi:hypothetical protein